MSHEAILMPEKTVVTLWRYYCSHEMIRDAILGLPRMDHFADDGIASFEFESDLPDRSLLVIHRSVPRSPLAKINYLYRINILHIKNNILAICCRRDLAWVIRNTFFSQCRLGTIELDVESLANDHNAIVSMLHCRLDTNPTLDIILEGHCVMRSDPYLRLGSASFVSVSLSDSFRKDQNGDYSFSSDGICDGTILSLGLNCITPLEREVKVHCTRTGTASIELVALEAHMLTPFINEVLRYEQRGSNWE